MNNTENSVSYRTAYVPAPKSRLHRYLNIIEHGTAHIPSPKSRLARMNSVSYYPKKAGTVYVPGPKPFLNRYYEIIHSGTAYVPGPKPFLNRYYEIIHSGTAYVPGPKPFLNRYLEIIESGTAYVPMTVLKPVRISPTECSIFDIIFELVGKGETYKVANFKDVFPVIINDAEYDGALSRVTPDIKNILFGFFNKNLELEETKGISSGTTTDCPEFRKFELEIFDEHNELQYFLIYGKGTLIDSSDSLHPENVIAILKTSESWEA